MKESLLGSFGRSIRCGNRRTGRRATRCSSQFLETPEAPLLLSRCGTAFRATQKRKRFRYVGPFESLPHTHPLAPRPRA